MDSTPTWILGLPLVLVLIIAIVITGVGGVRRAGGVLSAHQAALVGGRSAYGPQQGAAQAASDLNAWWGSVGQGVTVEPDPARRSLRVLVRGWMPTLFGGGADLGAGSFQRLEDFYPGPPDEFE